MYASPINTINVVPDIVSLIKTIFPPNQSNTPITRIPINSLKGPAKFFLLITLFENLYSKLFMLLNLLWKNVSDKNGVSQRLIASSSELEDISRGVEDLPSMGGWRYEIFGRIACELCDGKISLGVDGNKIKILTISS